MNRAPTWRRPPALLVAVLLLALAAAGCEHRSQQAPATDAPSARLLVSADYGARMLLEQRVPPDQSVMRALRGAAQVKTAYAGKFVATMFGRESDLSGQRDWFFYVNGLVGDISAADIDLAAGETVWWDHRFWGGQMDVGAVVGLWPEPFLHGNSGTPPLVSADAPLADALRAAGATVVDGDTDWRVRVGANEDLLARDATWRRASEDPTRAGLTAAIEDGAVTVLAADGSGREPVPDGRAIAVITLNGASPSGGALFAVVGLDAEAAANAARTIADRPAVLEDRYAVVFDGAGTPIRTPGREGP